MKRVLVTACNGYVGEHCLKNLLSKELVIVDAIEKDDAFKNVAEGIDYILHVASPMPFNVQDLKRDLLEPAVKGTRNILEEAKRQPSVKRVVITSSFGTCFDIKNPTRDISPKDWNPITWEEAETTNDAMTAYRASKTFAEKAAWEFKDTQRPHFEITTLVAPMVYGPMLYQVTQKNLNESSATLWKLIQSGNDGQVPPARSTIFVDVRDLAEAHVQAMEAEGAGGQRLFVISGNLASPQAAVDAIREDFPQFSNIPIGDPSKRATKPAINIDTGISNQVLKVNWTPFEKTIKDVGKQLVKIKYM